MGCIVIASSFLSVFINIPLHAGLFRGEDNLTVIQARERYRRHRGLVDASRHRPRSRHPTNINGDNASSLSWRIPEDAAAAIAGSAELGITANHTEPEGSHSEAPDIVS